MKALKLYIISFVFSSAAICTEMAPLDAFLKGTNSFCSHFKQVTFDEDKDVLQESQGTFTSRKPDMYSWITKAPNYTELLSNGEKVWFYDKELEQVTIDNMENSQAASIVLLAKDVNALKDQFSIELIKNGCKSDEICYKLVPKGEDSDFQDIQLVFDKETMIGYLNEQAKYNNSPKIKKIELKDQLLNTTIIEFDMRKSKANLKIDDKLFTFVVPKGIDVVDNS